MSCLYLTRDLLFSSQVTGAAGRSGTTVEVVGSAETLLAQCASRPVRLAIIDLTAPGLSIGDVMTALGKLPQPPMTIAYAPHVHGETLAAAQRAGCTLALTRGQFHAQMESLLREYGATAPPRASEA